MCDGGYRAYTVSVTCGARTALIPSQRARVSSVGKTHLASVRLTCMFYIH